MIRNVEESTGYFVVARELADARELFKRATRVADAFPALATYYRLMALSALVEAEEWRDMVRAARRERLAGAA